MEAPAELGVAAVFVGAAGVVTDVQLVAAFGHGRNAHVDLTQRGGQVSISSNYISNPAG